MKEQALCILANIADGDIAKSAIMSNEDVLKKLMNYMVSCGVSECNALFLTLVSKQCYITHPKLTHSHFTPMQVIPNVKLQIAATFCISNLIWNVEEGAAERQNKLREMGVYKLLQNLMTTTDTGLFDK